MDDSAIERSEILLRLIEKAARFSTRFNVYPYSAAARIVDELYRLAENIPAVEDPSNKHEVIQAELKRRMASEATTLEHYILGRPYDFNTVMAVYGIAGGDVVGLRDWLDNNRAGALASIDRLFESADVESYELGLHLDIPQVRRQAEEFAAVQLQKYHAKLGRLTQGLSNVGEYLRDISAVPTTEGRSYFDPLTSTLAVSFPAFVYQTEDGSMHIRERELVRIYGHEGMGHGLNQVMTKASGLPYFLTKDSQITQATAESLAQFYQRRILEDLKNSPETQRALGINHDFEDIYRESLDVAIVEEYRLRTMQYGISLLADKSLGSPEDPAAIRRRIAILSEVAIDPAFPQSFIEGNRNNFDSRGNLHPYLVSELRYAAQPVQRALDAFAKNGIHYDPNGRNLIDQTMLTGFWTPIGFVQNAQVAAVEGLSLKA
ncbi:hypothetical protein HYY74_02495 [Candidatus Woesearchaeota archaeon]|nr:hypothetical protein [Candidatus Woesearchaeota archaeon]